jgi:hypothetical protein
MLSGGCIDKGSIEASLGGTSIEEIVKQPETFLGEEVTVSGKLILTLGGKAFLEDSKGYRLEIKLPGHLVGSTWDMGNRVLYYEKTYSMIGVMDFYEKCECQLGYSNEESWRDYMPGMLILKEECLKPPKLVNMHFNEEVYIEYRCKPGSTIREYYLEVNDVL